MPSFKNILIPVDFSVNTDVAVKKAIELADARGAAIHLLHIQLNKTFQNGEEEKKLGQWKVSIEDAMPDFSVNMHIEPGGDIQEMIIEKAGLVKADLIVIGQSSCHSWFPFLSTVIPTDLSRETGCAVLTVKPGAMHCRIKTLVVPVMDSFPAHKLDAIMAICHKYKVRVHLVTFINGNTKAEISASSLLQVYQMLKTSGHCQVEYAVLHGHNKAKSLLDYSEKINADILLVHPKSETKIGWLNKHISDVLSAESKMQVLTVQEVN